MGDVVGTSSTVRPLEATTSAQPEEALVALPARTLAQRPGQPVAQHAVLPTRGRAVLAAVAVYCVFSVWIFHDTLISMVTIWLRSQTFAHGFLIVPISLWLIWRLRGRLDVTCVRPEPLALLAVLAAGLAWLVAYGVDVLVVEQLAFVAVVIAGVWAIIGTALAWRLAFPLGFLFLAVPMGGGLIAPLMTFTADTTEALLRLTGVPVFRESMYLMLPTGTWSVIEECSGVRYLIASFTLGLLYAYLTYRSLWRRTIFVAVAIIVPILANSLRAYGVVMVGHLSEMRFGIGGDHLIYGWAFFGLVMMLMFWIGGFWQQSVAPAATSATPTSPAKRGLALPLVVCLAILCAGIWPGLALMLNRNAEELTSVVLESPAAQGHWQAHHDANWSWQPAIEDADRELDQIYIAASSDERHVVGLHIRQYLQQRRGVELVSGIEPWRPDRRRWLVLSQQSRSIDLHDAVQVDEVQLSSSEQRLLVWSWYRVAGRDTANPYAVKLYEAIQQFLEGRRHGARIFIATPLGSDVNQARSILQNFVATHYNAISASLDEGASP